MMRSGNRAKTFITLCVIAIAAAVLLRAGRDDRRLRKRGDRAIETAFAGHDSNVQVEQAGRVLRILPDDLDGSRHQRFIVQLPSGHTVLVSHNIDIAPRIDELHKGAPVAFRGEYEWNEKGGGVHWTHRDPAGRHDNGWVEYRGATYD